MCAQRRQLASPPLLSTLSVLPGSVYSLLSQPELQRELTSSLCGSFDGGLVMSVFALFPWRLRRVDEVACSRLLWTAPASIICRKCKRASSRSAEIADGTIGAESANGALGNASPLFHQGRHHLSSLSCHGTPLFFN
ncbi:hypothetical protein BS50DRAFT_375938 [Corynespora cassiicola Philippines]|uniref:Uncharacterized protein n=1 Tax=Corynespora cassiicola Philippines TaxID=1448308 RepID=A0A2T2NN55_CORCC|nr:hypothetical protein BS50DRAFT_375938 [Corynespora cassiicola Philippines]